MHSRQNTSEDQFWNSSGIWTQGQRNQRHFTCDWTWGPGLGTPLQPPLTPMPVCVGTLRVSREPRSVSAVGSLSATRSAPSCHQSLDFRFYFIFLCVLSPCYGESVCFRTLCSEYQGTSLNVSWVRAVVSHKPPRGWRCTFSKFSLAASLSYAHPSYSESIL